MKLIKILSIILIAIVVLNLILFALGKITMYMFWLIILIIGVFVYFILPKIKNSN